MTIESSKKRRLSEMNAQKGHRLTRDHDFDDRDESANTMNSIETKRSRRRCRRSFSRTTLLFFCMVLTIASRMSVLATMIPSQQLFHARLPSRQRQQLWMYEGALYDPLDGRQICQVQGLEVVRPIQNTTNLAIDDVLKAPNATYSDAQCLWSQKIFCYTTINGTKPELLKTVRLRPQSPVKRVPLDQAVLVYETATTFVTSSSKDLLVHSEFPNGKTMWGKAALTNSGLDKAASPPPSGKRQSTSSSSSALDFTIYAKLRSPNSPLYAPDLSEDKSSKEDGVIVSPKRAALVQFGAGNMETKHKFGARETYSYRMEGATKEPRWKAFFPWLKRKEDAPTTTLSYTRYGEGPPFYAPGRMCMLELKAKPIACMEDATPLLQSLVIGGPIENFGKSSSIQHAWGLGKGRDGKRSTATNAQTLLQLNSDAIHQDSVTSKLPGWIQAGKCKAEAAWDRIRTATTMESAM